jgi:DNA-directed RNA polymerase subunit RPC12/RpoP
LIAVGLSVGVPIIFSRGKKGSLPLGAPRSYGIHGGAICPKCSRPFSRHIYGLNLGTHKYDRCPYCGKWSLGRRASKAELEAAEAAELAAGQEGVFQPQTSAEESLRRDLEESRFED